ncbi:MAG TPA: hypothetical protein VH297_13190 [Gaiellaceae bacterium]|jgi:hypothetical protein
MNSKLERWSTLAGVLAVPFWVAGVIVISTQATGEAGAKILTAYHDNSNAIMGGALLFSIGVVLFIWFLGALRDRFLAAEGGSGRYTSVAFGGGIAASVIAMLIPVLDEVGAMDNKNLDASGAAVLHHSTDGFFIASEYTLSVLFFASAVLMLRYAAFAKWLGWVSLLIGIVLLIGPIGWAAFLFLTPIWTLIVSFTLWRGSAQPTVAREPALGASG